MAEQTVSILAVLKDEISQKLEKISGGLESFKEHLNKINELGGEWGNRLLELAGGFEVFEKIKEALEAAKAFETAQAHLGVAVDGNVTQFNELKETVEKTAKSGVYSMTELTNVTQQLVERGVGLDRIPKTLQAIQNTAAALKLPLQEVATQVAGMFGGVRARSLARAVPELRDLSEAALKAGEGLDILSKKYQGKAEAYAETEPGKEEKDLRDIEEGWVAVGRELLPIERRLVHMVSLTAQIADFLTDNTPGGSVSAHNIGYGLNRMVGHLFGYSDSDLNADETPGNQQANANANNAAGSAAIKQHQKELEEEAKDARTRQGGLEVELQEIKLHGLEDTNKKSQDEIEKAAKEEFDTRVTSLQQYLKILEDSGQQERDRMADRVKNNAELLGSNTNHLKDWRETQTNFKGTGNVENDNEIRNTIQVKITASLERQVELLKESKELSSELQQTDRQRVDLQAKAIQDAIKLLDETGSKGAKSVAQGNLSPAQLQDQITSQINQISQAIPETVNLANKLLSPDDAKALSLRLKTLLADASVEARKAADAVTPLIADIDAVSKTARTAAEGGLAKALTDIETHAKSASAALKDMVDGFLKSILNVINQRLAENLINSVFGNGQGQSGLLGGIIGGVVKGVFGANSGGIVPGSGPDQDSVFAHLTPGEGVVRRTAVQYYGADAVYAMNNLSIPRGALASYNTIGRTMPGLQMNAGGIVPSVAPAGQPQIHEAVVAPTQENFSRMLKGGTKALWDTMAQHQSEARSALGIG